MGKIRIKTVGLEEPGKKEEKKAKKKTAKVPGLKGGERVKAVEGVIIEEGIPEAPKETKALKEPEKEVKKVEKRPKVRSKKYQKVAKLFDRARFYPLDEALELVKKTSISNFEGTVEAHMILSPKSVGSKFTLVFPHETGKKPIILAFGKDAQKAGADIEGDEETIQKIAKGFKDFTIVLATPEWMGKLAKVARFLGPKGLMPNPKTGTVTKDLKETIKKFKSGRTTLSTEKKAPVLHTVLGKVSWPKKDLQENLEALIGAIGEARIKKIVLCATMGPGIKVAMPQLNK